MRNLYRSIIGSMTQYWSNVGIHKPLYRATCGIVCRSTGIFVFVYSLFYFFRRSNMSGVLQSVQFFGYTLLACYVFSLMLGTVSFFASLKFIRYIYVNLKMD